MNEDANLLSVGAVDFGIIVDSAVILVENVFRNFQARPEQRQALLQNLAEERWGPDPTKTGASGGGHAWTDRMRMILISAMEVDTAVFFSAAITVAAFVPLFTMQGVEGQIFNPMARTYGFALAGALFATFTITPVLASVLLPEHIEETETILVRALRRIYSPALHFSLTHRKLMVAFGIGFLIFTAMLAPRLGTEFLPALEEGNLWIRAAMPPTISLDAAMPSVNRMREIIMAHPEVITVVSQHGRPDNGSDASGFNNAEFFVPLKPFDDWAPGMTKEKLVEDVQNQFAAEFPGITFNFSQYIQDNIEEGLSGVKGANSVKIIGPDLAKLEEIANKVLPEMDQVKGVADLGIFRVLGQPNLNVKVDRDKAARYGLNSGDVNAVVQAALGGTVATTQLEAERQFNVTVRLPPQYRGEFASVGNIKVGYTTPNGTNAYIPLRELAAITLDTGASYIFHERNARFIPIKFSVRGRDLGSTVTEAQERIAKNIALPNGYRIEWAGEFEELQQAKARLEIIVPISLLMILVLLYGLFNSLRDALLALAGIPFSIAGGIFALLITGLDFSISGAIRVRLAVRSVGDERHPDHHLLQPGPRQQRHEHDRGDVSRLRAADAADADDRALGLHRPVAGGDLGRHRQPGAEAARDRRRRRHAGRSGDHARRGARASDPVPGQRRRAGADGARGRGRSGRNLKTLRAAGEAVASSLKTGARS